MNVIDINHSRRLRRPMLLPETSASSGVVELRPLQEISNASMVEENGSIKKDDWFAAICERLNELGDLGDSWDGYGAAKIPRGTIHFAAMALSDIWSDRGIAIPQITPMSNESIMVEWRSAEGEISLEVNGPNDVDVLIEQPDGSASEFHATSDFRRVTEALESARQLAVA